MREMARKVLRFVVCLVFTGTGLLAIAWGWDVHNDRKHVVLVNSQTTIFTDDGGQGCEDGEQLTTLNPGVRLKVRRIMYQKDCATLYVTLPDGRKGYIVLGPGISVSPPL